MINVELTLRTKTLGTTFFVVDVQGNYNILLLHD
jgi:hypothetical protein